MTEPIIVSNASPIIALQRIGQLDLLPALLGRLIIPPAVRREVFGSTPLPQWIEEMALTQPLASQVLMAQLGAGETEAIALAMELNASRLLLDDLPARRLANLLNLKVLGTLGLLVRAKEQGLIVEVSPFLDALEVQDFRVSERLRRVVLIQASEGG